MPEFPTRLATASRLPELSFTMEEILLVVKHYALCFTCVYSLSLAFFGSVCDYSQWCVTEIWSKILQLCISHVISCVYGVYRGRRSICHRLAQLDQLDRIRDDQQRMAEQLYQFARWQQQQTLQLLDGKHDRLSPPFHVTPLHSPVAATPAVATTATPVSAHIPFVSTRPVSLVRDVPGYPATRPNTPEPKDGDEETVCDSLTYTPQFPLIPQKSVAHMFESRLMVARARGIDNKDSTDAAKENKENRQHPVGGAIASAGVGAMGGAGVANDVINSDNEHGKQIVEITRSHALLRQQIDDFTRLLHTDDYDDYDDHEDHEDAKDGGI